MIQFLIIQFRGGVGIALWQVPADSYREAVNIIKTTGQTVHRDEFMETGRYPMARQHALNNNSYAGR